MRVSPAILKWLAVVLIVRGTAAIFTNYPDYFPPNFDSLFLQGRRPTFTPLYRIAFYVHLFAGPFALLAGRSLLSETVRRDTADCTAGWGEFKLRCYCC